MATISSCHIKRLTCFLTSIPSAASLMLSHACPLISSCYTFTSRTLRFISRIILSQVYALPFSRLLSHSSPYSGLTLAASTHLFGLLTQCSDIRLIAALLTPVRSRAKVLHHVNENEPTEWILRTKQYSITNNHSFSSFFGTFSFEGVVVLLLAFAVTLIHSFTSHTLIHSLRPHTFAAHLTPRLQHHAPCPTLLLLSHASCISTLPFNTVHWIKRWMTVERVFMS